MTYLDKETEVLTENGWVKISDYSRENKIIVIREFLRKAGYKVEDEDVSYDYVNISKRLTVKKQF